MFLNSLFPGCPARETEWPCPEPVKLSPKRIEQEKQQAEKRFLEISTLKKYLGV